MRIVEHAPLELGAGRKDLGGFDLAWAVLDRLAMTKLGLLGVVGFVLASVTGCAARQSLARDRLDELLAVGPSRFDSWAQERALEALESVPDDQALAMRRPIERACLDGRGQEIAPIIVLYLEKLGHVAPSDAKKARERILTRCGVYEWQAREGKAAILRIGPRRYARTSETEVIRAVVDGTDG